MPAEGPIFSSRIARVLLAIYWPAVFLATHWPRLEIPEGPVDWFKPDKAIHTVAFGLLALFIVHARLLRPRAPFSIHVMDGCLIAALYAGFDEYTQQFFQRNTNLPDLIANFSGIFLAGCALAFFRMPRTNTLADKPLEHELSSHAVIARLVLLLAGPVILLIVLQPGFSIGGPWPGRISRFVPFDKLMHAIAACGLTLLLLAGRWFARWGQRERLIATCVVAALGPALELTQFFLGGDAEARDVAAHLMGLMIGLALWALWHPTRTSR